MDLQYEQKVPGKTDGNESPAKFTYPGQIDETDLNDSQKTPSTDDAPLFSSTWEDNTEKNLKERIARQELYERDQSAVEYSKSLLDEGDTLVYISYPRGITFYDSNGLTRPYKNYRVSSEKLKGLGSPKFSRMFEERPQYWTRRRKGLLHHLPDGFKYVLDLTPSEEGDEAVELVSELSCSSGIRNWHLSEKTCGVQRRLVSGDDEVPGPANISTEAAEKFRLKVPADGYTDTAFSPLDPTITSASSENFIRTSLGRKVYPGGYNFDSRSLVEDNEVQKAIKNSLGGNLLVEIPGEIPVGGTGQSSSPDWPKKEVLDYCPIRHRFGVENLLRIIQGKVPKLDSAPKVWTLFVLAKYYECTDAVVDYITSWIMSGNNIKFLEILPEASLNIGLGLKIPMITRAAFSVLVSEEALNVASRTFYNNYIDRRTAYHYIRPREKLDEDLWNVIQHASQDFCDRIQATITDLLDERMSWFLELPEYRKICKFEDYCHKNNNKGKKEETLHERRKSVIQKLLVNLRGYVRGRIVDCLNEELSLSRTIAATKHRREVQWEIPESGTQEEDLDSKHIYHSYGDREKVLLPYFWRGLRDINWHDDPLNSLKPSTFSRQIIHPGKLLVDKSGICQLRGKGGKLSFIFSIKSSALRSASKSIMDEERPNYAFMSAYNQDHAYHQARLAGIRTLELELAQSDEEANDAASMSSITTDTYTRPLIGLPLRPKLDKITGEHKKDEYELDTEPGPSTKTSNNEKSSAMKFLVNFWANMGQKPNSSVEAYKAKQIAETLDLGLQTDSVSSKGFPFADTSKPFSLMHNYSTNPPVEASSLEFSLSTFLNQIRLYIDKICHSVLSRPDILEFTILTDSLLCLTDNEWQYLPLWAGGNDDGSGGVTSADVPPAYYSNVGGLTPGVQYKGVAGFVGVGSSVNTSLDVRDGSTRTVTIAGSDVESESGKKVGIANDSDSESVFSVDSYDMVVVTPAGSGSNSDFEIVDGSADEEIGDEFTVSGDSLGDSEISNIEMAGDHEEAKKNGKDNLDVNEDEDYLDWTDRGESEDDWEGSFADN
ncbi:hypothetical protein DID88_010499 [Monilinia fructigena]|uniref:Uncharacterized protein n=1 Tax=Monilinia fructigena TaxID=38457 RepID=A0A395ILK6_9HELO|nr:hypothetical protein DID88_010499 [Monilinia fructigena]